MIKFEDILSEENILVPRHLDKRRILAKKYWLDKSDYDIASLIQKNPEKITKLPTKRYTGALIAQLLVSDSSLINYFEKHLNRLNDSNISIVLQQQPVLINYFKKDLGRLNDYNILKILVMQPSLINYFKKYLNKLSGHNIFIIISDYPSYISYFKKYLDKMSESDVSIFLSKNPQLSFYFEKKGKLKLENIISEEGFFVPRHIERRRDDIKNLWIDKSDMEILDFISANPEKINEVPKKRLDNLDMEYVLDIIDRHRNLISFFDLKKTSSDVIVAELRHRPYTIHYFDLSKLNNDEISDIIIDHPDLMKHFDINKLESGDVAYILTKRPELVKRFDLSKFSGDDIEEVLMNVESKKYMTYYLISNLDMSKLKSHNMRRLLKKYPDLIFYFDINKIEKKDIDAILLVHPQLSIYF